MLIEGYTGRMYCQILMGNIAEVEKMQQEAYQISVKIGNLWSKVNSMFFIAVVYHARGEVSRALEHIKTTLPLAIEAGHPGMGFLWVQLAWVYMDVGDLANARLTMEQALDATNHFPPFMALSQVNSAIVHQKLGDLRKAAEFIHMVESNKFQFVLIDIEFSLMFAKIEQARQTGDLAEALRLCDYMHERLQQTGARFFLPELLFIQGRMLLELGQLEEAAGALSESESEARRLDYRIILWRNLAAQARLADRRGEVERARELFAEAAAFVRWMLDHTNESELRDSLLRLVETSEPEVGKVLAADRAAAPAASAG
jgi:tetratricopeptide (TPR) repeat protein